MSQIRDTNHHQGMVARSQVRSNEVMTSVHPSENQLASASPTPSAPGAKPVGTVAIGIGPEPVAQLGLGRTLAAAHHHPQPHAPLPPLHLSQHRP